jgi:hypothetical protein
VHGDEMGFDLGGGEVGIDGGATAVAHDGRDRQDSERSGRNENDYDLMRLQAGLAQMGAERVDLLPELAVGEGALALLLAWFKDSGEVGLLASVQFYGGKRGFLGREDLHAGKPFDWDLQKGIIFFGAAKNKGVG